MKAHLVDGTYEHFRHHFGLPEDTRSRLGTNGPARGVLATVASLLEEGATHVGVATDKVTESFRNRLWLGYKTGEGASSRAGSEVRRRISEGPLRGST